LRICHVIESASGGSANILASLALHAVQRGHEVHVVYSPDRADEALIESLRNGGCASVRSTRMRRSVGPHDAIDGLKLRATLSAIGQIDVIHAHSSKAGVLARAFGRFRGTELVYSPHGFYTMTGEAPFYIGPVERVLSGISDRVIAVSDYERRHALSLGIAPDRVTVIPNGTKPFQPLPRDVARRELGLPGDAFVAGFVGRLAPQKDPISAIDVIDSVPADLRPQLAIIGDGELRDAAERRALAGSSRVIFCGSRDAKPLMSAFDCLLCTSRYEGMPVSFLEALNCGVPIVSYPVGGTEELVLDSKTGFVTAPDPSQFAAAVERIARMPEAERRAMASACRELAERHTDVTMGDATLGLYQQLLRREA
jgi:glycosyltransferase involved in cell wall biosynthesis